MNWYDDSSRIDPPAEPAPSSRRGRYQLTARGAAALAAYRDQIAAAQAGPGGRQALEESQAAWARAYEVGSRDALVLEAAEARPLNAREMGRGLEDCGMPKAAIESAIDRLAAMGLLQFAPVPSR